MTLITPQCITEAGALKKAEKARNQDHHGSEVTHPVCLCQTVPTDTTTTAVVMEQTVISPDSAVPREHDVGVHLGHSASKTLPVRGVRVTSASCVTGSWNALCFCHLAQ